MASQPIPGINSAWTLYRQCSATAVYQKSRLELFTRISLWLGFAGALVGTLAQVGHLHSDLMPAKILGVVGSLAVALAGVAAAQATADGREKIWVKCRGAGEGLKSSVYLFCAGVPPFDAATRVQALGQRVEKALKDLEGTELHPAKSDKLPPGALTVGDFINVRVDDQVDYYTRAANKYHKKADFWRFFALAAAAVGAAMGAVSAIYSLAPWVALLATVTASITAFVKNQRYSNMVGLYQATATRLQLLKDQWLDSGKTDEDKADRDNFIQRCEETMSIENGAWTSQWSQQTPAHATNQ